jgi:hypothetical protein
MSSLLPAERVDFSYEISDERLLAYSALPIIDRLRWLDEILRFTLAVLAAPDCGKRPEKPADGHP